MKINMITINRTGKSNRWLSQKSMGFMTIRKILGFHINGYYEVEFRIRQNTKLRIAEWLDKRHPEYCWATLVMWSFDGWFARLPEDIKAKSCIKEGSAYCGKCEMLGLIKEAK